MKDNFLLFLNTLEGFKTNLKLMHWNAQFNTQHELSSKIADFVSDLQDETAEQGFYDFGKFEQSQFYAVADYSTSNIQIIENIILAINSFRNEILVAEIPNLIALLDDALGKAKKLHYLANFKA